MSLLVVVAQTWGIPSILIRTLIMYIRCTVAHLEPYVWVLVLLPVIPLSSKGFCLHSSIGLWLSLAPCPRVNPLAVLCWPGPESLVHRLSNKRLSKPLSCDHSHQSSLTPCSHWAYITLTQTYPCDGRHPGQSSHRTTFSSPLVVVRLDWIPRRSTLLVSSTPWSWMCTTRKGTTLTMFQNSASVYQWTNPSVQRVAPRR